MAENSTEYFPRLRFMFPSFSSAPRKSSPSIRYTWEITTSLSGTCSTKIHGVILIRNSLYDCKILDYSMMFKTSVWTSLKIQNFVLKCSKLLSKEFKTSFWKVRNVVLESSKLRFGWQKRISHCNKVVIEYLSEFRLLIHRNTSQLDHDVFSWRSTRIF